MSHPMYDHLFILTITQENPALANIFLIELCIMGQGKQGQLLEKVPFYLMRDPIYSHYWKRNAGVDFFIVASSDHGPCPNFFETTCKTRTKNKKWWTDELSNVTFLTNEGSYTNGCFRPTIDFTVPTSFYVQNMHTNHRHTSKSPYPNIEIPKLNNITKRQHFIFFSGKRSSNVRKQIFRLFKNTTGSFITEKRLSSSSYLLIMANSKFCLCVRGQAVWSPRLDEAVFAGCIPVIIADYYEPPYSRLVDYSSFSVRIYETDIPFLLEILSAIPIERLLMLQINLGKVRKIFQYSDISALSTGGELTEALIAFTLWQKWKY